MSTICSARRFRLLALLLAMTCAGCASHPAPAPLARDLPPPAAFMAPVKDPSAKLTDDARARLAVTRDALREANERLSNSRDWYEGVRAKHAIEHVR